jgi:hypothetical protein
MAVADPSTFELGSTLMIGLLAIVLMAWLGGWGWFLTSALKKGHDDSGEEAKEGLADTIALNGVLDQLSDGSTEAAESLFKKWEDNMQRTAEADAIKSDAAQDQLDVMGLDDGVYSSSSDSDDEDWNKD